MSNTYRFAAPTLAVLIGLSACGSDSSDPLPAPPVTPPTPQVSFEVTVSNLTNAQPLSPIAVVAHDGTFRVFTVGAPSSVPLEELAEGGDNAAFLDAADSTAGVLASQSGAAPIPPGGAETLTFTLDESDLGSLNFSLATMLVNTNDAFSGVNTVDVSELAVGETRSLRAIAYDAGTEEESEAAGTIPGPAVGGEGFNAVRDDSADRVSMHAGVLSPLGGLATSVLTEQHRFDNPVVGVSLTRVN